MQLNIWRRGALMTVALAMAACSNGAGGTADRIGAGSAITGEGPVLSGAEYLTASDHFSELQQAALSGDYAAFARHMGASDPGRVIARLEDSFGGGPFDLYTLDAEDGASRHRRAAELRGPSGRLYLYLELARADGGWNVRQAELVPDRAALLAHL